MASKFYTVDDPVWLEAAGEEKDQSQSPLIFLYLD